MKKESSSFKYIKTERGFMLITILMVLAVITIFGISLLSVTASNFKQTGVERNFQSVYYIAEAGINNVIYDIGIKVDELSSEELSHEDFFDELNKFIVEYMEDGVKILDNFEESFGEKSVAEITVEDDDVGLVIIDEGTQTKGTINYIIKSVGKIGSLRRTVSTSIEVGHGIEKEKESSRHPAFDYALYSGNSDMAIPSGSTIDGSVYAHNVKFNASGTKIKGAIISEKSIELSDNMLIEGNICAMDGIVKILSSQTKVFGDIHAADNVILSSGTNLNGNIFTNNGVTLQSSGAKVNGDIHAKGDIALESSANVNNIFTMGNVYFISNGHFINGSIHAVGDVGNDTDGGGTTVSGHIYSGKNVTTRNYQTFKFYGNVHAVGNVTNGNGNEIHGDVISRRNVFNRGIIRGTIVENGNPIQPQKPIVPKNPLFEEYKSITKPELNKKLLDYQPSIERTIISTNTLRLSPGNYGIIEFDTNQGGTIILESGGNDYFFNSIIGGNQRKTMRLDFSKGGNINVYLKNNLKWSGAIEISTDGVNWINLKGLSKEEQKIYAERVYWENHGSFEINEGGDKQWVGTLLSRGDINIASSPYIVGSFVTHGKINSNNKGGTIIYASQNNDNGGSGDSDGSGGSNNKGQNTISPKNRISTSSPIREK